MKLDADETVIVSLFDVGDGDVTFASPFEIFHRFEYLFALFGVVIDQFQFFISLFMGVDRFDGLEIFGHFNFFL